MDWWENRKEIIVDGFDKSKNFPVQEIVESNYNLDLCGFPKVGEIILDPEELMVNYQEERTLLNKQIDNILEDIQLALGDQL